MGADEGYFRLWNPDWTDGTIDNCVRSNVHGRNQMTFEIAISEAASAVAELGTAADTVLYGSRPEVTVFTALAATSTTTGDYYLLSAADGDGTETGYYVWLNEAAGGGEPAPGGIYTNGLEVAIGGADNAATVGGKIQAVVDAVGTLTCTNAGAVVTTESDNVGDVVDSVDGNMGVIIATTYQGAYQTACKLFVVSSQANDSNAIAAADAQKVCIIGLSVSSKYNFIHNAEKPIYTVEEINLAGATYVETERAYVRVMHMYCCDWGTTGSDAVGNITLVDANTGTGHTLLTIDAGSNESNSSGVVYVPDGRWGRWKRCFVSLNDEAIDVT